MVSNKLKISLVVAVIFVSGLVGFSFFVENMTPTIQEFSPVRQNIKTESQKLARISIDSGDGRIETLEIESNGKRSLLQIMKERFAEEGIELFYESYSGLGEFVTQIGDKKGGANGKYWQYWVNGSYAQVGASLYVVNPGDIIEWKFTNERQ